MAARLPCRHDGCPGLEMHNGKPDGCGHPTIDNGCMAVIAERDGLRLAFEALSALLREDYGSDMSLADIAETWPPTFVDNPITPEHIAALHALEGSTR